MDNPSAWNEDEEMAEVLEAVGSDVEELGDEDEDDDDFEGAASRLSRLEQEVDEIANHAGRSSKGHAARIMEQLDKGEAIAENIHIPSAQSSRGLLNLESKRYAFVPDNAVPPETVEAWALDAMERKGPNYPARAPLLKVSARAKVKEGESALAIIMASLAPHVDTLRLKAFSQVCKEVFVAARVQVHERVEKHPDTTDPIHLLPEQRLVYDLVVRDGKSIYVHGEAGSGKTMTLRATTMGLRNKDVPSMRGGVRVVSKMVVVVAAPTGTAAEVCGGLTIASLFGQLSTNKQYNDAAKRFPGGSKAAYSGGNTFLLMNMNALIIDEISMVSWQDFELMSSKLKEIRHNSAPFGGVQLICFGDFAQLPPVSQTDPAKFPRLHARCLNSPEWAEVFGNSWDLNSTQVLMLSCNIRQREDESMLRDALRELRKFEPGEKVRNLLADRNHVILKAKNDPAHSPNNLLLASDNKFVDEVNTGRMRTLVEVKKKEKQIYYRRWEKGPNGASWPANVPETTTIADGARVQLTRNALACRLTNGSRGTVHGFVDLGDEATWMRLLRSQCSSNPPSAEYNPLFLLATDGVTLDGESKSVTAPGWARNKARFPVVVFDQQPHTHYVVGFFATPIKSPGDLNDRVIAIYEHLPLRVAYAGTLHRCQGSTVTDNVTLNLSKCFSAEQVYVAFSRVRAASQIVIAAPFDMNRLYGPRATAAFCQGTIKLMQIFELRKQLASLNDVKENDLRSKIERGLIGPGTGTDVPKSIRDSLRRCMDINRPYKAKVSFATVMAQWEAYKLRMIDEQERIRLEAELAEKAAKLAAEKAERELQERLRRETEERLEAMRKERAERLKHVEKLRNEIDVAIAEQAEGVEGGAAVVPAAAAAAAPEVGQKRKDVDDDATCKVCYDAENNCAMVPCGHQALCYTCGIQCKNCPICRKPVQQVLQLYRA